MKNKDVGMGLSMISCLNLFSRGDWKCVCGAILQIRGCILYKWSWCDCDGGTTYLELFVPKEGWCKLLRAACVKGWWCNLQIGGALSGDVVRVKLHDPAH